MSLRFVLPMTSIQQDLFLFFFLSSQRRQAPQHSLSLFRPRRPLLYIKSMLICPLRLGGKNTLGLKWHEIEVITAVCELS